MKTVLWIITVIAVLIIAVGLLIEGRYVLIVDAPVVAKIDRLTGHVYVANGGMWRMIESENNNSAAPAVVEDTKSKTK